jgi:hypothetical protein
MSRTDAECLSSKQTLMLHRTGIDGLTSRQPGR